MHALALKQRAQAQTERFLLNLTEKKIQDLTPEGVRRALTPACIAGLTADQTRLFLVHHREHIMHESQAARASSFLQRASGSFLGGSESQRVDALPDESGRTTPANLKCKGWKLKGVVAALTAAEALAAGFTHEEYAAALEKHAAAPEPAAGIDAAGNEAGSEEEKGEEVIGA